MPRKNAPHQATIRDVAEAAGVSTATVSKFINGLQRFTPEVEEKLRQTISLLGYRQNRAARSMVTGKTGTIGLAVLGLSNPFFSKLIKGANRMALAHNHDLLVVDLEENMEHEHSLLEALAMRVDGMIVSYRISESAIERFEKIKKPVVYFGKIDRPGITCVSIDGYQAAVQIARHLVKCGYQRIAYVGHSRARWNMRRIEGMTAVLAEAGLELDVYDTSALTMEGGLIATDSVLNNKKRPDAIAACNDLVAFGLMHGLRKYGLRVPEDIAIAGMDNIPFGEFSNPPLTSVDTRSERQGEVAVQSLLEQISAPNEQHDSVTLESYLIVRESTRNPIV